MPTGFPNSGISNKGWFKKGQKTYPQKTINITKEELENLYINKKISATKIADLKGYSFRSIYKYLRLFGIKVRTKREAHTGMHYSAEHRLHISEALKGKEVSEETREKIREANKRENQSPELLRRRSEAQKGKHLSEAHRKKIGDSQRGIKKCPFSKEHRQHISESKKGKKMPICSLETRAKLSAALIGNKNGLGVKRSPETRIKMGAWQIGRKRQEFSPEWKKHISESHIGFKHTDDAKQKIRIGQTAHRVKTGNCGPTIGKHETQILDEIEQKEQIKIKRQYVVLGYFLDGYCEENNTAYEIDEKHHKLTKQKQHDTEKQIAIENNLNCKFIRILDTWDATHKTLNEVACR